MDKSTIKKLKLQKFIYYMGLMYHEYISGRDSFDYAVQRLHLFSRHHNMRIGRKKIEAMFQNYIEMLK